MSDEHPLKDIQKVKGKAVYLSLRGLIKIYTKTGLKFESKCWGMHDFGYFIRGAWKEIPKELIARWGREFEGKKVIFIPSGNIDFVEFDNPTEENLDPLG